jgi:hypothetical protein
MSNSFNRDELARWFDEYENCVWCGESGADCFDHVILRANKYSNSILNASPSHNHKCNINQHGKMHTRPNQEKMIKHNAKRLNAQRYKLTELDLNFIKEHNLIHVIADIL